MNKYNGFHEPGTTDPYVRRPSLILLNGLAEQAETWFRNHRYWRRHFDVYLPNLLVYDGVTLHARIQDRRPISVQYLVDQLHCYLARFVQAPPYHIVASSMGCKIAVELAAQWPQMVSRMVLLCPSGLGDQERLPIVEGVRRGDCRAMVDSVFHNPARADAGLVNYYQQQFANRRWRLGLVHTIRDTMYHSVRPLLSQIGQPTFIICGREDRIVNSEHAAAAAGELLQGRFVAIPRCGHAPQIEKARLVNRLVGRFLTETERRPVVESRGSAVAV